MGDVPAEQGNCVTIASSRSAHRASGLNLVAAAVVFWNTMYLERAVRAFQRRNPSLDEALESHF